MRFLIGLILIDHGFFAFNRWLNFSRGLLIIVVGETNCRPDSIRDLILLELGGEFVKALLQVNCHMYGEIPYHMIVQSSETSKIRQLILLSYHSHAWPGNHLRVITALHDCLHDAACEMAQIRYEDGVLFSGDAFWVSAAESERKKSLRFTPATIVSQERKTGTKVSEHQIRKNVSDLIPKNPLLFFNGTPLLNENNSEGILETIRMQGHTTQAAKRYPSLVQDSEIHAARGYTDPQQGRET
ncbi:hypothetical protein F5Y10DRAFT_292230 [Nemania abortiva]|nr:hypothetical protein F5Y10DRAFT_292230 [Nemania abortiva]